MSEQAEAWSGEFGSAYLKRNRVDWRARIPFWSSIMQRTNARSVHEVGANAGWNLSAIKSAAPYACLYGNDVNSVAVWQARKAGLDVGLQDILKMHPSESIDLVFTAGVLIHIGPDHLRDMMQSIIETSCDYVLAVEYAADEEVEIEYRGNTGMLWKRPYGNLYQDFGLKLVGSGDAGNGFDRCAYWLLRK